MRKTTSPHILNTAATLLGFCLFVITSLHIASRVETVIIDEITSIIATLLTTSCVFSFVSMRAKDAKREQALETIADYLFLASLVGILVVILLITMNYIK